MKRLTTYLLLFPLLALSACSGYEDFDLNTAQPSGELLTLCVSANNFTTVGDTPSTRATDNGMTTTFENGDRVGVIVLDGSNCLLADNIPYTYNGSQWAFDSSNNEDKTICYYDNKATTYIVYYPYSSQANNITSVANLKARFAPQADQRSRDDYRASDLMVWSENAQSPLKTLNAELKHAYISVSLLPTVKWTLATGETVNCASTLISDVNCTIDGTTIFPYQLGDRSYRCILPDSHSGEVRCFFTLYGNKTYSYTHSISLPAAANTCYAVTLTADGGSYGFAQAQVGDYYCRANNGSGYLIPGDVSSPPADMNYIGIVFKVGKDASDQGNYKNMNDGDLSINGYVVALQDASSGVLAWANKDGAYGFNVKASTSNTDWQGYFNCQQIKDYVSKNGFELGHFPAANACLSFDTAYPQYAAPASSSGWFLPSAGQLKDLYNSSSGLLSDRISTLKNTGKYDDISWFSGNWYWSSSESSNDPASNAWIVNFHSGNVGNYYKRYGYYVRGVFAF